MGVGKSQSQVTDAKAVRIVKELYDDLGWTTYDISPDFGIDQKIEIVESGKHTAIAAYAQIKGHLKLKRGRGGFVSQEIECEHFEYYLKCQMPVFLLVVDVPGREGYWAFVQEYAEERLDGQGEARRRRPGKIPKVTIRVPLDNRLTDRDRFKRAVIGARRHLASRLMNEGLAYDREVYEGLDPRFRVSVTATERGKHFDLRPVEDVTATFSFNGNFVASGKYHTLVGRGLPVKLEPGEVKVQGSLLLGEVFEQATRHGGMLHCPNRLTMGLCLSRIDKHGREVGRIDHLRCEVEGGASEFRFVARTENGMLKLSSSLSPSQAGPSTAGLSYSFRPWFGRPIMNLPHYDDFCALFDAVGDGDRLDLIFRHEGQRVPACYIPLGGTWAGNFSNLVEVVRRGRWIAERFGVNPILPDLDEMTWNGIGAIHAILHGGQIEAPGDGCMYETAFAGGTAEEFFRQVTGQDGSYRLRFDRPLSLPFLGRELDLGLVSHDMNGMKLDVDLAELKRRFVEGEGEVRVRFVGSGTTKLLLKMADDPEARGS